MAFKKIKSWAIKYNWASNRAELLVKLEPTGSKKITNLRGDELKLILDILSVGHQHTIDFATKEIAVIDRNG